MRPDVNSNDLGANNGIRSRNALKLRSENDMFRADDWSVKRGWNNEVRARYGANLDGCDWGCVSHNVSVSPSGRLSFLSLAAPVAARVVACLVLSLALLSEPSDRFGIDSRYDIRKKDGGSTTTTSPRPRPNPVPRDWP